MVGTGLDYMDVMLVRGTVKGKAMQTKKCQTGEGAKEQDHTGSRQW